MSFMAAVREKIGIFAELWAFMRVRKKFWLGPIIVVLVLLAVLMAMSSNPVVAPFIYAIF